MDNNIKPSTDYLELDHFEFFTECVLLELPTEEELTTEEFSLLDNFWESVKCEKLLKDQYIKGADRLSYKEIANTIVSLMPFLEQISDYYNKIRNEM